MGRSAGRDTLGFIVALGRTMKLGHASLPGLALAAASLWLVPGGAQASCFLPSLEVLWTYPADGDQDVPTNAVFWALATGWRSPDATIDGVPLAVNTQTGETPLGNLAPNQDHVLRLDYTSSQGEGDAGAPPVL